MNVNVIIKIWGIIVLVYLVSLAIVIVYPIFVRAVTATFTHLDRATGGFATPSLIVLLISGLMATLYVHTTLFVENKKEPLTLVVAAGTMFSNMFKSSTDRRVRQSLSEIKPVGVVRIVLFNPSQEGVGTRSRWVR